MECVEMLLSIIVISFRIDVIDGRGGILWRAEESQQYVRESGKSNANDESMCCII